MLRGRKKIPFPSQRESTYKKENPQQSVCDLAWRRNKRSKP
jgi:hypothetical protein